MRHNTHPIAQFIIVEDSGSHEVAEVVGRFPISAEIIINETPKGQIAGIDLAYSRVRHPLIFHCEDDWYFFRPGFIEDSLVLLKARSDVSMVGMVADGVLLHMDAVTRQCAELDCGGVGYRFIPPRAHDLWFSYSFNPGLRRTADYKALGSFAAIGHEADISLRFKKKGMSMAVLANPACTHIGEGRHVGDPIFRLGESPGYRAWRDSHRLGR